MSRIPSYLGGFIRSANVGTCALIALLGAGVVSGLGSASAEPTTYALPACYGAEVLPTERPNQVQFQTCADGSKELTDLVWTAWGPNGADATGTYSHQVCVPNCAAGYRVPFPVVVHADEPIPAVPASGCPAGTVFYANLVLAFPRGVPDGDDSPINSRFRGSPAVLYSTEAGPDAPTGLGTPTC